MAAWRTANDTSAFVFENGLGCQRKYTPTQASMMASVATGRRRVGFSSLRGITQPPR